MHSRFHDVFIPVCLDPRMSHFLLLESPYSSTTETRQKQAKGEKKFSVHSTKTELVTPSFRNGSNQ